jgi:O-antigen/teichoic acid export membrane protein/SAM-dependent methyltransferase
LNDLADPNSHIGAEVDSASPRLISDSLVNYSGLAVGTLVGILLVPVMLSRLGTARYGLWIAALTLASTLRAIDFGLGLVVMREVAAAAGTRHYRRTAPLVSAAGGALLLLGAVGAVLLVAGALALAGPLRLPDESRAAVLPVFALVGVAFVAEQGIGFVSSVLAGLRRFGTLNLISVALVLLRAVGTVLLLLLGYSLIPVAIWYAGSTLIVAGVSFAVLRSTAGGYGVGLPGRHWRSLRRHLPFGLASFLSVATAGLVWQALPLLAAALLGAGAIVSVHVGQKIPLALTGLYGRLATVVFPAASEYQRTKNVRGTQAILQTGTRLVLHLMIPVVIVGLLAAPDLLRLWLGDASRDVAMIFRLTLLAVLADAIGSVAINVLWGRGRVAPLLVAAAASAAAVVGASFLVLPRFGTPGGAAVLALVLTVASIGFWVLASRAAEVRPISFARGSLRGIGLPALACAVAAAAALALPGIAALPRLALAAIASTGAYVWLLARFGSTADERKFMARAARLPREIALPVGRALGARLPTLRSLGYLLLSLSAIIRHPNDRMAYEFDRTFAATRDPWGYGESSQRERIQAAMHEVDLLRAHTVAGVFESALEAGCAEGAVTELLAPRCRRLVAADLSAVALARCEERCAAHPGIEYRRVDVAGAAAWGPYELVVAMDVLECIRSPWALRRARNAAVDMLLPGGHLVVTTTRQHPVPETAWWGRWLPVGARINDFVGRHPSLQVVRSISTMTHAITVYGKTS